MNTETPTSAPHCAPSLASFVLLLVLLPTSADAQVETTEYTVEAGDTCQSIAQEFYDHEGGCDLIEKYNTENGESPTFEAGETLQLPTRVTKPEARVDRKHGSVRAREPDREWHPARLGQALFRSWRVNTLELARARLGFRDASTLKMREQTLVIIYGASREQSERKRTRARARLTEGTLRSRLDELSGDREYRVETPSSYTSLMPGNVLFDVDDDETTRVANHGGGPVEVRGRGNDSARKTVTVDEGMGTRVEKGRAPTPPRELPPAPSWTSAPRDTIAFEDERVTVSAAWKPVDEAERYFVELTGDREGVDVLKSSDVPADVTRLEVRELPPGDYWATVSSVDDDEMEGIPSERRRLRVVELDRRKGARLEEESPTFVLGTELHAPSPYRCRVGETAPAEVVRLRRTGSVEITCRKSDSEGEGGRRTAPRTAEVVAPTVGAEGPTLDEGRIALRAGSYTVVDLQFDPAAPPGVDYGTSEGADAPAVAIDATPLSKTRHRVKLSSATESTASTDGETELVVTAGGADGEPVELARIPVDIRGTEARRRADTSGSTTSRRTYVGARLGGVMSPSSTGPPFSGVADAAVTYFPEPGVALEPSVDVVSNFDGLWSAGGRIHGLAVLGPDRLRALFGGGLGLRFGTDRSLHPFLGATAGVGVGLTDRLRLRADLGSDLELRDGRPQIVPRFTLGVFFRLPRGD